MNSNAYNQKVLLSGESGHPIRSPLRERNIGTVSPKKTHSPIKVGHLTYFQFSQNIPSRSKRMPFPLKSSPAILVTQDKLSYFAL